MKRISKNIQGFKGRSRSFTVEVVRKGGAEPPKRPGNLDRRSQPLRPTPVSKSLRSEPLEKTTEIPTRRPWQAAGARIVESLDQPEPLEIRLEPEPHCGQLGREKLNSPSESENGERTAPEAVTAEMTAPAKPKKASAPRKRTLDEIIANMGDTPTPMRTMPPESVVEALNATP